MSGPAVLGRDEASLRESIVARVADPAPTMWLHAWGSVGGALLFRAQPICLTHVFIKHDVLSSL